MTQIEIRPEERAKALEIAIKGMEKRFGTGTLMRLGERPSASIDTIPTGCTSLDLAVGIGGYPRGRVVEIYGPEASGKTTLTLHAIAEAQRRGGTAAFIDAEHALDVSYAEKLGVDVKALLVSQPDSGEQALEIAEALVRSGAVDLLVVDSVAALVPQAEIDGEMGDQHMGLQARLMSQALRKLTSITSRTGCVVIFINQVRQKIGVTFGNGEVTTGGNALKFYASLRLEIRRIGSLKDDEQVKGARTKITPVKNKMAPPFRTVEVDVIYGRGICPAADLLALAEKHAVVTCNGSWYKFGEEKLGQGKDNVANRLLGDIDLMARIRGELLAQLGIAQAMPEIAQAK